MENMFKDNIMQIWVHLVQNSVKKIIIMVSVFFS